MYQVSDEFKHAVKNSHNVVTVAEVYDGTTKLADLEITGGSVNIDIESSNLRRCNVNLGSEEYTPRDFNDLLHTQSGHEIRLYRGLETHHVLETRPSVEYSYHDYNDAILSDNPYAFWPLNEKRGNVAYELVNNYNGEYIGEYSLGSIKPGKSDDRLPEFDGASGAVVIPNTDNRLQPTQQFTMELWFQLTGDWEQYDTLAGFSNNSWDIRMDAQDSWRLHWYSESGEWSSTIGANLSPATPMDGKLHHLVIVWDGLNGQHKVYLDKELMYEGSFSSGSVPRDLSNQSAFHIASSTPTGRNFAGGVGRVALYDYVLSESQIESHYDLVYSIKSIPTTNRLMVPVVELVPLGVFGIEDTEVTDGGDNFQVNVKGFDRSKEIQRRRFTTIYQVPKGTNYGTAIHDLLETRWPGLTYNFPTIEHTTPSLTFGEGGWSGGGDPWEKAQEMATNIGMVLYFNVDGSVRLAPQADPLQDPVVWEYEEGPESTLLYVTRSLTRENVFNHVVAIGNHSGLFAPIRADAVDDNPDSPTYINGPFGDVPTFHRSTMIFTQTQAQEVADAQLLRHLGTPENVRFISMVNPAHEVGDVVRIKRERAGIDSVHVLDKLNIPLDYTGSINATARERRVGWAT